MYVVWESGCSLAESPGSESLIMLQLSSGSTWGWGEESVPRVTHMVISRMQLLKCCWTEGFSSLLAIGWTFFSVPCYVGSSQYGGWFSLEQASKWGREVKQVRSQNLSWKPITFAIFYVFEGSRAHTEGQGVTRGYKHQEAEYLELSLKLPTTWVITRGWFCQKQKCLIKVCILTLRRMYMFLTYLCWELC